MNAIEIVKTWNAKKGTKYQTYFKDRDSAIVQKINLLISKNSQEEVENYFYDMLNSDKVDMWAVVDDFNFNSWKREKTTTTNANTSTVETNTSGINVLNLLSNEIVKVLGSEIVNNINNAIETKLNEFVQDKVLTKVIDYKGEHKKVEGVVHEAFEEVISYVAMNEPVMMIGSAGTGKNVIAKQVADALGLNFYFSNAVTQEYKITGYGDANGEYVKTEFYDAFTKGGIFLLDEVDASCPEALIVLNSAIANRYFDFPVIGRVEAHPDFRVIANANTYGTGASMQYVGRNQLDGATLDRFATVEVDYDKRIEENVCPDKDILDFCRAFRKICDKNGTEFIVSYRAMGRFYKMVNIANLDKVKAMKGCLTKQLEQDTLKMIYNEMSDSLVYKEVLKKLI